MGPGWPKTDYPFQQVSYSPIEGTIPAIEGAEFVEDEELCAQCHKTFINAFAHNVHGAFHCEACHGPASKHMESRGKEGTIVRIKTLSAAASSEVCLKCHEQNACSPGSQWRRSKHAHRGVSCLSCHRAHYNVPPGMKAVDEEAQTGTMAPMPQAVPAPPTPPIRQVSYDVEDGKALDLAEYAKLSNKQSRRGTSYNLGALAPNVCYKCHADMQDLQRIAGPHQIGGPNGFNCTTCHDAHGNLLEYSRAKLCLQCHGDNAPTMAWHTGVHAMQGVACTDCHNPHPRACVPRVVEIDYGTVRRQERLPMKVQEPEACYKCHENIRARTLLPSHHPILEGKMVCSDCHDAHGQYEGMLNQVNLNLVCYKCHADKEGPFAYEHPPVTEDCTICHEPHGTVADDLLQQPTTFLCLRCHTGHRGGATGPNHDAQRLPDFADNDPPLQQTFFTDCTQCHSAIHGSDIPSPHVPGVLQR